MHHLCPLPDLIPEVVAPRERLRALLIDLPFPDYQSANILEARRNTINGPCRAFVASHESNRRSA